MDESCPTFSEPSRPIDAAVGPLREKRRRLRELLSGQREQLGALEAAFEHQLERLRQADAQRAGTAAAPVDLTEFEAQRTALAEEAQALAQLSEELDQRQAELVAFESRLKEQEQAVVEQLRQQQAELDERAAELDAAGLQLRRAQRVLAASEEELSADREHAAQLRERLQEQLHAVEHERESINARRSETNNQRRRIARELQHQRQAQKAALAKEREVLHGEREALTLERERQRSERAQQHSIHASNEELESLRQRQAQLLDEMAALREEHDRQAQELAAQRHGEDRSAGEIDRLHADVEALQAKLAESEARAANAPQGADSRKRDDLKRRFELAVEDIRELKQRNAELEEQLADARSGKSTRPIDGNEKLDWEAQKRRLLAELEADNEDDEDALEERLSIEGTIRITDEIVARKEQEIAELKRILEEQSSNLGTVAIGAAAIAEAFDQDELIRQERENLVRVQQEWRDKLKQAEIDISVERARVARERLEMDEKLQWLEAERQKLGATDSKGGGKGEAGSANQRRWWARLGLKEADDNV